MSKTIKISVLFFIALAFSVFFYSCNEKDEACESCMSNYETAKIQVFNYEFDAKKFQKNPNSTSFYHIDVLDINRLENFYKELNDKINNIKCEKTSVIVFIQDFERKLDHTNINFKNQDALIIYEKNQDAFNVRVFEINNNNIVEIKNMSNHKTNIFSTNDIYDLSKLILRKEKVNVYTLFNPKFQVFEKENYDLTNFIESQFQILNISKERACNEPCEKSKGKFCNGILVDEFQVEYKCENKRNGGCAEEAVKAKLKEYQVNNYDFEQISNDLHDFKNLYLSQKRGGNKVIDTYYKLSEKLPLEDMNLNQCISTFNLLTEKVLPLINNLKANPESNVILIDNATKNQLNSYLYEMKQIYPDIDSKNRIQNLINKIEHFSNKSNSFITNNLNDF